MTPEQFAKTGRIWIVACGTSWHAGLVGKYLIEEWSAPPCKLISVRSSAIAIR